MNEGLAKIKFSITDGLVEIEGSEAFVGQQLTKLEPLITKILQSNTTHASNPPAIQQKPKDSQTDAEGLDQYQNVFALADGKVQILKDLPGNGKAQKTVNAALLLAYANTLQGINTIAYEAVRSLCSAHACLDSNNFSKTMKAEKEYFIITGNGGAQSISLTVPGKRKALEVANSLNT